jgi:hypothetical protein
MNRNTHLTLPELGSVYPYSIDGHTELFAVAAIDSGQGLMQLESVERTHVRPTFINDVVRFVRPNNVAAWLPVLREQYSMDADGRAALIAEAQRSGAEGVDLSRDLYATIGDPVPPLVWPRQESEQSPARTEIEAPAPRPFKVGDRVKVARKVETDSKGRDCHWDAEGMDATIGTLQTVARVTDEPDDSYPVRLTGDGYWYSPEALEHVEE